MKRNTLLLGAVLFLLCLVVISCGYNKEITPSYDEEDVSIQISGSDPHIFDSSIYKVPDWCQPNKIVVKGNIVVYYLDASINGNNSHAKCAYYVAYFDGNQNLVGQRSFWGVNSMEGAKRLYNEFSKSAPEEENNKYYYSDDFFLAVTMANYYKSIGAESYLTMEGYIKNFSRSGDIEVIYLQ